MPIKEIFHSRMNIIHILNMCLKNTFVNKFYSEEAFVRGREYTGEQHISLVDLNNCCDFDDLLINAYVKKSYA